MKIEKLSLNGIKNVLSRAELKKIMAGSGGGGPGCENGGWEIPCCTCYTSESQTYYPQSPPLTYLCSCFCTELGYPNGENDCPY